MEKQDAKRTAAIAAAAAMGGAGSVLGAEYVNDSLVDGQTVSQPETEQTAPATQEEETHTSTTAESVKPAEPVAEPVEPLVDTIEPVPDPIEPVSDPIEPVPDPIEPVPDPIEPVVDPIEPVVDPIEPVVDPIEPYDPYCVMYGGPVDPDPIIYTEPDYLIDEETDIFGGYIEGVTDSCDSGQTNNGDGDITISGDDIIDTSM